MVGVRSSGCIQMVRVQHLPLMLILSEKEVVEPAAAQGNACRATQFVGCSILARIVVAEEINPLLLCLADLGTIFAHIEVAADKGRQGPICRCSHPGQKLVDLVNILPGQKTEMDGEHVEWTKGCVQAGTQGQAAGEGSAPAAKVVERRVAYGEATEHGYSLLKANGILVTVGPRISVGHPQALGQPLVGVEIPLARYFLEQSNVNCLPLDQACKLLQPLPLPAMPGPVVPEVGAQHSERRFLCSWPDRLLL